ncbi:Nicotinate-nucleotide pyrophosphorylase (carboxylating) [Paraglaciecola mesophila]|uniref:Probable nicotinate-nucleotide pyrophosphorylase [carboxylating] n=1 Tax=Paraglaciecola mesophila TaxID=197222 RepID=A0A857JN68_9ALTE|nr:carboxylating nicotinate-nucleotide diphosphorylase [Paraglaciecola mesophila]QHJ13323.1 Nicotinate-nucleotide pyrophosphorylase (carboxylating) [Paraglaciecola mesophila]
MLQHAIQQAVKAALLEDLGGPECMVGDITANLIPEPQQIKVNIITREDCVVAGKEWVNATFQQLDNDIKIDWKVEDAQHVIANTVLCEISGNARMILTGERTALNFLQTLSGTATVVADYVKALGDSETKLLDTRKTLPGMRLAQKYAVTCGGGKNHRIGLYDAYLIKENHILACGSIANAIEKARQMHPDIPVEVEVENLDELSQALDASADIIMLDNFTLDDTRQAVLSTKGKSKLEVSGNITKERIAELAKVGVDYISSGALTKHVQAIDLSLRVVG